MTRDLMITAILAIVNPMMRYRLNVRGPSKGILI